MCETWKSQTGDRKTRKKPKGNPGVEKLFRH